MRDNFISTIVNFDTEDVTDDVREKMKKYLSNPEYNFEKVKQILHLEIFFGFNSYNLTTQFLRSTVRPLLVVLLLNGQ